MNMTKAEYSEYVKLKSPNSPLVKNMARAMLVGGLICCVGQGFLQLYGALGFSERDAGTLASMSLIFLGVLVTGLNKYDDLARFAGAGSIVPITGFANSMASPALEFKSEGFVTGMCAKMFIIAGPVIVFGITASVVYGLILAIVL